MDEHELLLRHAERWAGEKNRLLDVNLMATVLQLRAVHDGMPANRWPARSATHVMLTRWPAHGPVEAPDVPTLLASLETYWRFLRNTGRMAGGSAEPADLVREAKAAGRRMVAVCADPANYGQSKILLEFGREIGISLDGAADADEANRLMQEISAAWNALPDAERVRRMPVVGNAESRMGRAVTDATNHLSAHGALPEGWHLPDPPRLDEPEEDYYPSDPALAAPQVRASRFVQDVFALVDWVGDGRQVTKTEVLRPAVARQAYAHLGLWEWEREWRRAGGYSVPDDPKADELLASSGMFGWRTAADCLPLDRLWYAALSVGLIAIEGGRAIADPSRIPTTDEGWVELGLMLLLCLAQRTKSGRLDLLVGLLLALSSDSGEVHSEGGLVEWWVRSPKNPLAGLDDEKFVRIWSERDVRTCLYEFADCNLWTDEKGSLAETELGWDFTLTLIGAMEEGIMEQHE